MSTSPFQAAIARHLGSSVYIHTAYQHMTIRKLTLIDVPTSTLGPRQVKAHDKNENIQHGRKPIVHTVYGIRSITHPDRDRPLASGLRAAK